MLFWLSACVCSYWTVVGTCVYAASVVVATGVEKAKQKADIPYER